MATYIEYQLGDGATILVEADEKKTRGWTKASNNKMGDLIASVDQKFEQAFAGVKKSAMVLHQQLEEMRADEVTVTFGLKAAGEAGNFAIGRVTGEANYTVTLKWGNKESEAEDENGEAEQKS